MTLPLSLRLNIAALAAALLFAACAAAQDAPPAAPASDQAGEAAAPLPPQPVTLTVEQRGDLMMAKKMFREAIDIYRTGLSEPASWILYNKIGIAYHHLQDFKAARKNYEDALRKNRQYGEAQNNLGAVYYAQKDYRRAIQEYQKALKLTPYSATTYSNLGTAYYARKNYDWAMQSYRYALQLDPMVFEQRGTTGSVLQERSVEEQARFHYFLAKSYAQAGMPEYALRYIRRSLEEGFKERQLYLEEPEFAALKELPEFQQLMAMEIRAL